MSVVKILSMIFLSVFLIFTSLADFMGFHLSHFANFILGGTAVTSGVLMLLSIREFYHFSEEDI
jgi:hypothetical protein